MVCVTVCVVCVIVNDPCRVCASDMCVGMGTCPLAWVIGKTASLVTKATKPPVLFWLKHYGNVFGNELVVSPWLYRCVFG